MCIIKFLLYRLDRRPKEAENQIGFMSPLLVNQKVFNENYKETCQSMYNSLTRQNYKFYIFIPYNYG